MDGGTDGSATDGQGVNKKLMRLSVDTRVSAKRSSILFDNSLPVTHQTQTLLKDEENESPSGQIRISRFQSLDGRFPRMEEMSHFHYNHVEFHGLVQFSLSKDQTSENEQEEASSWMVEVTSGSKVWMVKRSDMDIIALDRQIHRCVFDRGYSHLESLSDLAVGERGSQAVAEKLEAYFLRLTAILNSNMNCGPVLNWFELDNHGNHLVVMEAHDSALNVPGIAAAKVTKRYIAQAPDEITLEVNDLVSVIDMPPNEETMWWRGKKGLEVGFFPSQCVEILVQKDIGKSAGLDAALVRQRPVTKRRGKFISFLRNFFSSRPSKDELMQTGILRERVFGCDLGEHLTNTGRQIPLVLEMCSRIIEEFGIVDGIYRLSGITSNMQRLRVAFDSEEPPRLTDPKFLNDIHCISSLLKTYFRELPNPLMTYELYDRFVNAMAKEDNTNRTIAFHHAIQRLPPPHYRTLEFLLRHLSTVAARHEETNMNVKNLAIVWSPNLLKPDVQEFGQRMLSEIRVQALIMEYLLKNVDLFFDKNIASAAIAFYPEEIAQQGKATEGMRDVGEQGREIWLSENMAMTTTPPKLISLEEARARMRERKDPVEANGVNGDEEDGGTGKVRHKVRAQVEPPKLASFPVSEGPSLITIEEAQARSRSRSAKIPRRGSVDLVEFRIKSEKDGPLVLPSPSPKKRLWKMIFARSKSSTEYQEAIVTMPKTASLSNYRKRNDSTTSLQGRSFSSYNLGDYVRSSNNFLDHFSVNFSARTRRVEISEPIPHRTESFTSYIGGSDLLYIDAETSESFTDTKIPQKRPSRTSRTSRTSIDTGEGHVLSDGSGSPFLRKSKRKGSGLPIQSGPRDHPMSPESPSFAVPRTSPSPSQSPRPSPNPSPSPSPSLRLSNPIEASDSLEFPVRSATSPARMARRKIKQLERPGDGPVWIRASRHYQADLLPKDTEEDPEEEEHEKAVVGDQDVHKAVKSTDIESISPKYGDLVYTSFAATERTYSDEASGEKYGDEGRPPSFMALAGFQEDKVGNKEFTSTCERKPVTTDRTKVDSGLSKPYIAEGEQTITRKADVLEVSQPTQPTQNAKGPQELTYEANQIVLDHSKMIDFYPIHDRLVQRTSNESSSVHTADMPDVMSMTSQPSSPTTLTFISTSELPKPQVAVRPPSISDKLVNETAQYLEERRRQLALKIPMSSRPSKRHSYASPADVQSAVVVSAARPMTRHESISFGSGEASKSNSSKSRSQSGAIPIILQTQHVESTDLRVQQPEESKVVGDFKGGTGTVHERRGQWFRDPEVDGGNTPLLQDRNDRPLSGFFRHETQPVQIRMKGTNGEQENSRVEQHASASTIVRHRPVVPQSLHRPLSELSPNVMKFEEALHNPSSGDEYAIGPAKNLQTGLNVRSVTGPTLRGPLQSADALVSKTAEKVNEMDKTGDFLMTAEQASDLHVRESLVSVSEMRFSEVNQNSLHEDFKADSKERATEKERSRKIRNSLLSRGSRELESHSNHRSQLSKKAVSSDDLRSFREGQFLRSRSGGSIDLFAKSPAVTERRISIGDKTQYGHPDQKEVQATREEEREAASTQDRTERSQRPLLDWVPVMQQSLSGAVLPRASTAATNDNRATYPGRRPTVYDNVVAKRLSIYDNFRVGDL